MRWMTRWALLPVLLVSAHLLLAQLQRSGSYLGVKLTDIDTDRASALKLGDARGAEVASVVRGSAAEAAGVKSGDVLLTYNGENILSAQQLGRLVAETPQGRKVRLQYWRDGKVSTTTITTGTIPAVGLAPEPVPGSFAIMDVPIPMMVWKNAMLGVLYEPLDSQLAGFFGTRYGVLVRDVDAGSLGESAGLKPGDVITYLGGHLISSPRDLISFMRVEYQPGETITLALVRAHREIKLRVSVPVDHQ